MLYDVLYTWYLAFVYTESCCSVPVLLLQQLLAAELAVAVRHRVLDGSNCCWFIESDSIHFVFLFIQTRFIFNEYTPWQYCRIYRLDLPILHPR